MPISPLPSNFRGRYPSSAIASYDYTDLADGTGIVELYAFSSKPGGTLNYHLGKTALEVGGFVGDTTNAPTERRFLFNNNSVSFDLGDFNSVRTVKGTAFVNFTICTLGGLSGAQTVTISILKNSTELASTTITTSAVAGDVTSYNVFMDIARTQFKKGDNLILKFACTESLHICLEHDPKNRSIASSWLIGGKSHAAVDATNNPTKCTVYIPFEINN